MLVDKAATSVVNELGQCLSETEVDCRVFRSSSLSLVLYDEGAATLDHAVSECARCFALTTACCTSRPPTPLNAWLAVLPATPRTTSVACLFSTSTMLTCCRLRALTATFRSRRLSCAPLRTVREPIRQISAATISDLRSIDHFRCSALALPRAGSSCAVIWQRRSKHERARLRLSRPLHAMTARPARASA